MLTPQKAGTGLLSSAVGRSASLRGAGAQERTWRMLFEAPKVSVQLSVQLSVRLEPGIAETHCAAKG